MPHALSSSRLQSDMPDDALHEPQSTPQPQSDSPRPATSLESHEPSSHPCSSSSPASLSQPVPTAANPIPPRRRPDPWAHRRGEPRLFAFLWSLFLFAATLTTFGTASSAGQLSHDTLRPAARTLLVIIAVGISLAWPLVRLSQIREPHPIRGCARDILVILVPVNAVLWPQCLWWLAQWPLGVIAALVAILTAWTILIAALLAFAQLPRARFSRNWRAIPNSALWMFAFIALAVVGVIPVLLQSSSINTTGDIIPRPANLVWMTSPITGVLEIARERAWTGTPASITRLHWLAIAILMLISLFVWIALGLRGRAIRRGVRFPDAPLDDATQTPGPA